MKILLLFFVLIITAYAAPSQEDLDRLKQLESFSYGQYTVKVYNVEIKEKEIHIYYSYESSTVLWGANGIMNYDTQYVKKIYVANENGTIILEDIIFPEIIPAQERQIIWPTE